MENSEELTHNDAIKSDVFQMSTILCELQLKACAV